MRQRLLTLFAMLLIFPLPVFSAAAMQDEQVELVFRQFDAPNEIEGLVQAVDSWNENNPNIQVRLENAPAAEWQNQYVREVQAGGGPDIQHLSFVSILDLARNNLLLPLDPLIESSPLDTELDDFLGLELAQSESVTYALPWSADTFAMAYRPDIFETAGITVFPDTWGNLFEVASQLTTDTDGDGRTDQFGFCFPAGSAPSSGQWFLINYYLWSNGSTLIQADGEGEWRVGVSEEAMTDAVNYFNSYFEEQVTPQSLVAINSYGDPEIVGGLARGDCAISFFPPQTFRAAEAQSEQPLMTAPIPQGSETRISHLGGRGLGINPNSDHPEEAWEFIKYLASSETFETYDQYPARQSLLNSEEFPETEQGYVEMLPQAITFEEYISSPVQVMSLQDAVNRQFGSVYSGQKSPEQGAADLVAELEALLAESNE